MNLAQMTESHSIPKHEFAFGNLIQI